jgi:hypothetical protein
MSSGILSGHAVTEEKEQDGYVSAPAQEQPLLDASKMNIAARYMEMTVPLLHEAKPTKSFLTTATPSKPQVLGPLCLDLCSLTLYSGSSARAPKLQGSPALRLSCCSLLAAFAAGLMQDCAIHSFHMPVCTRQRAEPPRQSVACIPYKAGARHSSWDGVEPAHTLQA